MQSSTRLPSGLYGITPDWTDFNRLFSAIEQACSAGLPILQWRRKHTPFELACEQASLVAQCCHDNGTLFVVNDDWRLALEVGADAVHLGRDDGDLMEVKAALPHSKNLLIGVSCYNQLELAQQAINNHVDYVAFGAVFSSSVKPDAVHAPLSLFAETHQYINQNISFSASHQTRPNVVGIGGITLANAQQVIEAGADNIAVISGLFETSDVFKTCRAFMQLFTQYTTI